MMLGKLTAYNIIIHYYTCVYEYLVCTTITIINVQERIHAPADKGVGEPRVLSNAGASRYNKDADIGFVM